MPCFLYIVPCLLLSFRCTSWLRSSSRTGNPSVLRARTALAFLHETWSARRSCWILMTLTAPRKSNCPCYSSTSRCALFRLKTNICKFGVLENNWYSWTPKLWFVSLSLPIIHVAINGQINIINLKKKRHSERRKYNLQINKNNLANIRHLHGNGASVWYDCHSNPNLSFIK